MNKTIVISTDVFAALWGIRKPGEDCEDSILRRLLDCEPASGSDNAPAGLKSIGGVYDHRNNVEFPRGFEIFRSYKGKMYKALAIDGAWQRRDNGESYPTLNQLNASIVAGCENVWNGNWKYRDELGTICSVNFMREHQRDARKK